MTLNKHYLRKEYLELEYASRYQNIKNRFKYLCKMIKSDFKESFVENSNYERVDGIEF